MLACYSAEAVERRVTRAPSLHAPSLLDLEVTQAIRRYCAMGQLRSERGGQAIADLAVLPVRRYPHTPLLERIWQLRTGSTAYAAAYVAGGDARCTIGDAGPATRPDAGTPGANRSGVALRSLDRRGLG